MLVNLLSLFIYPFVLCTGRQGYPKKRLLRCNPSLTRLYWDNPPVISTSIGRKPGFIPDLPAENKSIDLADVVELRRGDDPDTGDVQANNASKKTKPGKITQVTEKRGTEILRRNCKPKDLHLCFSFILPSRTLDIQCLSQADFDVLFPNFDALVRK